MRNLLYEDDPAVTQVKANLMVAERVQQERAEQRRLEREEQEAEAERLMQEIEEAEQRELDEAELEQLTLEKERLEEETHIKQQRMAVLHGSERAAEWRRAVLQPEAGPSQAPPQC